MNVRELIQELCNEDDFNSSVYVRFIDDNGNIRFMDVDGIAIPSDSYCHKKNVACTTLLLGS